MEKEKKFLFIRGTNDAPIEVIPPVDGDPVYTAKEFADKAMKLFECSADTVMAAFEFVGLDCATKAQAVDFITTFKNRSILK